LLDLHRADVTPYSGQVSRDPEQGKAKKAKALDVDLLPDVTSDEMREPDSRDDWLRAEVPPHHGD